MLEKTEDLVVLGSAASADTLPDRFDPQPPDIFVLDIHLKSSDGFEALRLIQQRYPGVPTLVFSMHDEAFYAERALQSGAKGYLMKTEPPNLILKAIRKVLRGEYYVSSRLQSLLFAQLDSSSSAPPLRNPISKLTNRELQVIQLIGSGKNNREIAAIMNIRLKTVEAHRFRIKEKLNLKHSTELIQFAVHWVQREGVIQNNATA